MRKTKNATHVSSIELEGRLTVIQTVYAVIMAFGFSYLVEGGYLFMEPYLGLTNTETINYSAAFLIPILTTSLLGLRFFWAVVNIRRYIERVNFRLAQIPDAQLTLKYKRSKERNIVLLHVPILIGHGFIFYFICRLTKDLPLAEPANSAIIAFIIAYSGFQYFNALWILWLAGWKPTNDAQPTREKFWVLNNFIISTVGIALLFIGLLFSVDIVSLLVAACGAFIVGSIADLTQTAYHYLESPESDPQLRNTHYDRGH